jgi:hypothetical protein
MPTLNIELPDTPAARELLRTLAVHCTDDNLEHIECEVFNGNLTEGEAEAQVEANEAFNEAVEALFCPADLR